MLIGNTSIMKINRGTTHDADRAMLRVEMRENGRFVFNFYRLFMYFVRFQFGMKSTPHIRLRMVFEAVGILENNGNSPIMIVSGEYTVYLHVNILSFDFRHIDYSVYERMPHGG